MGGRRRITKTGETTGRRKEGEIPVGKFGEKNKKSSEDQ